jgi:tripartite-type tricarboxylate transporter receptor subunit TctC
MKPLFWRIVYALNRERIERRILMAAIDTLNENIIALTAAVDRVLAAPAGVPEAQVQAAADAVAVQTARLPAAPVVPAPVA